MLFLPAIDILGGKCVRLYKGQYDKVTEYFDDPVAVAKGFVDEGSQFIHIVDLDGAKNGKTTNMQLVLDVVKSVDIPVQVGGGIRTFESAAAYLDGRVQRIIMGTSALKDLELIKKVIQKYGNERVLVSLDFKNGKIGINGWTEEVDADEVFEKLLMAGVKNLIVTDITKDGTLEGPNFELLKMVKSEGFNVIAAGGVTSSDDIQKLSKLNLSGAIVGKAIYEGRINLKEASKESLAKRIIPCMDIADGRVVKGTNFKDLKDAGDAVELAKLYNKMGADELVFLDITATVEKRKTLVDLVERIAKEISIPFTVGGGIKNTDDIRALLNAGADKVSIGSMAIINPEIIKESSAEFGAQCIVISLDCKKSSDGWELYIKGGREKTGIDAVEFAVKMEEMGAGELLVNSLDRDGMKTGYDIDLLREISNAVNIPVIASSGAGSYEDFWEAFICGGADAALAASLFHYGEMNITELKQYLNSKNITVRL